MLRDQASGQRIHANNADVSFACRRDAFLPVGEVERIVAYGHSFKNVFSNDSGGFSPGHVGGEHHMFHQPLLLRLESGGNGPFLFPLGPVCGVHHAPHVEKVNTVHAQPLQRVFELRAEIRSVGLAGLRG